jgi:hypothetical protein
LSKNLLHIAQAHLYLNEAIKLYQYAIDFRMFSFTNSISSNLNQFKFDEIEFVVIHKNYLTSDNNVYLSKLTIIRKEDFTIELEFY